MEKIENDCVGCDLPCLGDACPYRNVPHYYCDECKEEEQLYWFDEEQLCINCIAKRLDKVNDFT